MVGRTTSSTGRKTVGAEVSWCRPVVLNGTSEEDSVLFLDVAHVVDERKLLTP